MAKVFTIHLNTNFRIPFWTKHSLAVSFVHPHHLTFVLLCLQDDDSDFLCFYASDLYGNIPKGKCGGAFYFVVFVQRKKKKSKTKRRNKVPQKKKNWKKKMPKKYEAKRHKKSLSSSCKHNETRVRWCGWTKEIANE